jgi:hypothetical protein
MVVARWATAGSNPWANTGSAPPWTRRTNPALLEHRQIPPDGLAGHIEDLRQGSDIDATLTSRPLQHGPLALLGVHKVGS